MTYFVGPFELMLNTDRSIQLDNDGGRHYNIKFLERVKKLTLLASKSFHSLNVSNQWNISSNHRHGMANGKGPCDNCGVEHYNLDFSHACDKVNIKKAKEERVACRAVVDAVADAKVTARSGSRAMIICMGI